MLSAQPQVLNKEEFKYQNISFNLVKINSKLFETKENFCHLDQTKRLQRNC